MKNYNNILIQGKVNDSSKDSKSILPIKEDRVSKDLDILVGHKWGDLLFSGSVNILGSEFIAQGTRWLEKNNFNFARPTLINGKVEGKGAMVFPGIYQGTELYKTLCLEFANTLTQHYRGDLTNFENSKGIGCLFADWVQCSDSSLLPVQNAQKFAEDLELPSLSKLHKACAYVLVRHLQPLRRSSSIHVSKLSSTGAPLFLFGEDKARYARLALSASRSICGLTVEHDMKGLLSFGVLPFFSSGIRRQSDGIKVNLHNDFSVKSTEMNKKRLYPDLNYALSHGDNGSFKEVDYKTNDPLFHGARVRFVWALSYGINIQLAGPAKAISAAFSNSYLLRWKGHDNFEGLRRQLMKDFKSAELSDDFDNNAVALDFSNFEATQDPYLTNILIEELIDYMTDDYKLFCKESYGLGCFINSVSKYDNQPAIVSKGESSLNVALKSGTWFVSPNGRLQGGVQTLVTHSLVSYAIETGLSAERLTSILSAEDARFNHWFNSQYLPAIGKNALELGLRDWTGILLYDGIMAVSYSDDTFFEDFKRRGSLKAMLEWLVEGEGRKSQRFKSGLEPLKQFLGGILLSDGSYALSATSFLDNRFHSERGIDSKPEGAAGFFAIMDLFRKKGHHLCEIPDLLERTLLKYGVDKASFFSMNGGLATFRRVLESSEADAALIEVVNDPSKLHYKYSEEEFMAKYPEIFDTYFSSIHYSEWQLGLAWGKRADTHFPIPKEAVVSLYDQNSSTLLFNEEVLNVNGF